MTDIFRYKLLFVFFIISAGSTADTKICKKIFNYTQNPHTKTQTHADVEYTIQLSSKVEKQITKLPAPIKQRIHQLLNEIQQTGPIRGNWPNFSKITPKKDNKYHCHLKKGQPTYVACWNQLSGKSKLVEFHYIGTHEKAPY